MDQILKKMDQMSHFKDSVVKFNRAKKLDLKIKK